MLIINLQLFFISIIYNSFDIFLKGMNSHMIIEHFVIKIKCSKKSKKEILYKLWLEYNKNRSYKAKRHGMQ